MFPLNLSVAYFALSSFILPSRVSKRSSTSHFLSFRLCLYKERMACRRPVSTPSPVLQLKQTHQSVSCSISNGRLTYTYCRRACYWLSVHHTTHNSNNSRTFGRHELSPFSLQPESSTELLFSTRSPALSVESIPWSFVSYPTDSLMYRFSKLTVLNVGI